VEDYIRQTGRTEVPSKMIGDRVIAELRELDPVSYIRYAIVYLGLEDLAAVRAENQPPAGGRIVFIQRSRLMRRGLMSQERPQDSVAARLSPNALEVLRRRYLRRGPDGKPAETVEEMFRRVARHIAAVEAAWNGDVHAAEEIFYDLLTSLRFVPNSPTFTGAGTPLGQLAACFVLPVSDDMGRRDDGIFQTLRNMALIHQTGGGTGFSFSRLRPKDTVVLSSGGKATGPVGFMRVYDLACEIVSRGHPSGANMGRPPRGPPRH
jgi:ribonucleotide reductase alpha subunit